MLHVVRGRQPRFEGRLSDPLHLAQTRQRHVLLDLLGVHAQPEVVREEFKRTLLHILHLARVLISNGGPK